MDALSHLQSTYSPTLKSRDALFTEEDLKQLLSEYVVRDADTENSTTRGPKPEKISDSPNTSHSNLESNPDLQQSLSRHDNDQRTEVANSKTQPGAPSHRFRDFENSKTHTQDSDDESLISIDGEPYRHFDMQTGPHSTTSQQTYPIGTDRMDTPRPGNHDTDATKVTTNGLREIDECGSRNNDHISVQGVRFNTQPGPCDQCHENTNTTGPVLEPGRHEYIQVITQITKKPSPFSVLIKPKTIDTYIQFNPYAVSKTQYSGEITEYGINAYWTDPAFYKDLVKQVKMRHRFTFPIYELKKLNTKLKLKLQHISYKTHDYATTKEWEQFDYVQSQQYNVVRKRPKHHFQYTSGNNQPNQKASTDSTIYLTYACTLDVDHAYKLQLQARDHQLAWQLKNIMSEERSQQDVLLTLGRIIQAYSTYKHFINSDGQLELPHKTSHPALDPLDAHFRKNLKKVTQVTQTQTSHSLPMSYSTAVKTNVADQQNKNVYISPHLRTRLGEKQLPPFRFHEGTLRNHGMQQFQPYHARVNVYRRYQDGQKKDSWQPWMTVPTRSKSHYITNWRHSEKSEKNKSRKPDNQIPYTKQYESYKNRYQVLAKLNDEVSGNGQVTDSIKTRSTKEKLRTRV